MDSVIRNNTEQSRYELMLGEEVAGFVEYRRGDGPIELTHTEVDPTYEGEGVGSQLAHAVLDDVREHGLGMLPYCAFIAEYLKRHPEYADLVPEDRRSEFGL